LHRPATLTQGVPLSQRETGALSLGDAFEILKSYYFLTLTLANLGRISEALTVSGWLKYQKAPGRKPVRRARQMLAFLIRRILRVEKFADRPPA